MQVTSIWEKLLQIWTENKNGHRLWAVLFICTGGATIIWIFHLFDDTVLIRWRQCVNQIDATISSSKKEICSLVFFEHSSLIFYSNSLTLIDLLPLIWMRYEFAVILSSIASAIALLPKFSCHPCGINCEANIVEWILYLNSNNSKMIICWMPN